MLVACFAVPQLGITCERARHASLMGRPLVLAREGRSPEVAVASDEAKIYAIRPGESVAGATHRCPDLVVLPYD